MKNHSRIFVFLLLIITTPLLAQRTDYIVSGKVVDENQKPLVGVNIYDTFHKIGTTTDVNGQYQIKYKNALNCKLEFKFIGYKTETRILNFFPKNRLTLNISLKPDVLKMQQVEITEKKFDPEVGSYEIKIPELRTIPGFFSDALTAVKTLPGVGSNNEMSNTFHVHGGSANDNLLLLEGIELPQPKQIRNSYQEGMSPLNPALIQNFQLITGGFPARYGGKLHSVVLSEYRQSAPKLLTGEVEVSFLNSSATLEGQLGHDGYWAVASRYANNALILKTLQKKGDFTPEFFDLQGILRFPISSRHRLSLLGIYLNNQFSFSPSSFSAQYNVALGIYDEFRTEFQGDEKARFRAGILSTLLESKLTPSLQLHQALSFQRIEELDRVNLTSATEQRLGVDYLTGMASQTLPYDTQIEFRDNFLKTRKMIYQNELKLVRKNHIFNLGMQVEQHDFRDQIYDSLRIAITAAADSTTPVKRRKFYSNQRSNETSFTLFAGDTWHPLPVLDLDLGIRTHYFSYNRQTTISPRFRIKWAYTPKNWLSFSTGQYVQPPEYREFRGSDFQIVPNVRAQEAWRSVVAWHKQTANNTEIRIEGYFIRLNRLIPYEYEDIFIRYQTEYPATGQTYGATFYMYGKLNQRLNSWLSYHYMVARQNAPGLHDGNFATPTDQRHTVSMVLEDDMPQVPGMRLHSRVLFGSGYPFTAYSLMQNPETEIYEAIPVNPMKLRMAYYRRLDMGFSYSRKITDRYRLRLLFEVFNIFNFRNVLAYKIYVLQSGQIERVRNTLSRRMVNFKINLSF